MAHACYVWCDAMLQILLVLQCQPSSRWLMLICCVVQLILIVILLLTIIEFLGQDKAKFCFIQLCRYS